ncbi:hypothetical protein TRVL_09740 [Trypanosoma vivax]|nr:hypothetical protein TRVL_09740 [Trypanosoma vivax]
MDAQTHFICDGCESSRKSKQRHTFLDQHFVQYQRMFHRVHAHGTKQFRRDSSIHFFGDKLREDEWAGMRNNTFYYSQLQRVHLPFKARVCTSADERCIWPRNASITRDEESIMQAFL